MILHNDVVFTEFDRNFNLIHNNILPDIIARSINHENYNLYRMNFVRYGIVDGLMEQ
jgi:hypothetical protein